MLEKFNHMFQQLHERVGALDRRLSKLERFSQPSLSFSDGTRVRVRVGLQDDGKYGVRVWNSSGTLVVDDTTT